MKRPVTAFILFLLFAGSGFAGFGVAAANNLPAAIPWPSAATSQSYNPERWTVVGSLREHRVRGRESLLEIARTHGLGHREIIRVNPDLDQFLPGDGATLMLPTARVLPKAPFERGILLNLAEKRLYYFYRHDDEPMVISFPVGIGADYADTPLGDFTITSKVVEPSWTVPKSIREKRPYLPAVVPPGPNNPMGSHALQLSNGSYFIHGTNRPWSIGRRATHGCIRLYPEDIPVLFHLVPPGTPVRIINQAVKVGRQDDRIYLEIHHDLAKQKRGERWQGYQEKAERLLAEEGLLPYANRRQVALVSQQGEGIPILIGRLPPAAAAE